MNISEVKSQMNQTQPIKAFTSAEEEPSTMPTSALGGNLSPTTCVSSVDFPMSAGKALKLFMSQLTDYEKGEILDYKQIYFMGIGC